MTVKRIVCLVAAAVFLLAAILCSACAVSPGLRRRYGGHWRGSNLPVSAFGNALWAGWGLSWSIALFAVGLGFDSAMMRLFWLALGGTALLFVANRYDRRHARDD